ncbi:InaA protein [Pseudomonas sp. GD03842]|uniref:lipopolysaccharide kinase InaA family protein n=1 Tax=unclassified Pseudomonas TaxID=196821 RepID=UPI000D3C6499|nr:MULTISPECIES: lipopolysaccharide kinase InaA family protein [unclassified Pseudomonas]MDH0748833.1 InaA protein [Pseudomonas sp. GD03842]RAU44064.1 InaA protein [Pseudomonas sp. RIT 409]RAU54809.1 InaA protein [Pseudomonas sp. RIT 412]
MSSLVAQDFDRWWNTSGPWVEEPNVRRSGTSGVQRVVHDGSIVYVKRQTGHTFRSLRYPFGRPTVMREGAALDRLQALGVKAPQPIFYGARKVSGTWQGLLVTRNLEGFTDLDSWFADDAQADLSPEDHLTLLNNLAVLLARLHRGRQQHGCMRSKHIFINADAAKQDVRFDLALLDLEKSRPRNSVMRAARHDVTQLRRHSYWSDAQWSFFLEQYQKALGRGVAFA